MILNKATKVLCKQLFELTFGLRTFCTLLETPKLTNLYKW